MADRYPDQGDYGRNKNRGRFSRDERWSDDDWRRRGRQSFGGREEDEEERRGYGAYGGAYGQRASGAYGGGYDRPRREWDEDIERGGGYRGGYGQSGMRGQSYGGGYRDREEYDRAYGLQGSPYSQGGQSIYEPGEQTYPRHGQGGYQQTGQGWGEQSSYGPGGYGSYGPQGYGGRSGQREGAGYSGPSFAGQRAAPYSQAEETYRDRDDLAGPSRRVMGGYGGQFSGYSQGFGPNQGFGSEQSGSYLTRGGRQQWGRHAGRGPKNYTRSDDRIREDVNDRLTDDPDIDATEIDVKVSNCDVTLTGAVESREDKRRAEDIVEAVSGVRNVQNNLRVQASGEEETRTGGKKGKAGGDGEQRMQ
jgi:hypothetical protein